MILRKRLILVALVIGWLVSLGWDHWLAGGQGLLDELARRKFAVNATRYRTYLVKQDGWMEFQIVTQAKALRVFTNAALVNAQELRQTVEQEDPRLGYRYAIEYQIVDRKGIVLAQEEYHFRARLLQSHDRETQDTYSASFFDGTNLIPATTRTMPLPLTRYRDRVDRIRLRLVDHDANIGEVVARVYCQVERARHDQPAAWQQLSQRNREKLTRASVYSPELMSHTERQHLLRWRWTAAVPIGLNDKAYERRMLYVRTDVPGRSPQELHVPADMEIHPRRNGVVPLPNERGVASIELAPLDAEAIGTCSIRWFGRTSQERQVIGCEVGPQPRTVEVNCDGGLLELASDVRVSVRIKFRRQAAGGRVFTKKITPAPRSVRMFKVRRGDPVDFSMSFVGQQATPFKLRLRTYTASDPSTAPPASAIWQYLDSHGAVLRTGKLSLDRTLSKYDQLFLSPGTVPVTEATNYYFLVPPQTAKIRLLLDQGNVLAAAYTRPAGACRHHVVPDDYRPLQQSAATRRAWYTIRPDEYDDRINGNLSISCRIQPKPPADKAYLLNGDFDWEDFRPEGNVVSRHLLTEKTSAIPTREQALSATFLEVPLAEDLLASWAHVTQRLEINPKLIYQVNHRGNEKPMVQVTVDDKPIFHKRLESNNGELELPQVTADELGQSHIFRFESTADVRLFVSYLRLPAAKTYLRRFVHQLQPEMKFNYQKRSEDPELLMLRVFRPLGSTPSEAPLRLRVSIDGAEAAAMATSEPSTSYSITNRIYDVRPSPSHGTLALGTQAKYDNGQLCFLPLGNDLPGGEYVIRVQTAGKGYLMIYRSLPTRQHHQTSVAEDVSDE